MVKNMLTMQETGIRSLGWKDPLEKEMATHSSILAWEIPWTEETGGLHEIIFPSLCSATSVSPEMALSGSHFTDEKRKRASYPVTGSKFLPPI